MAHRRLNDVMRTTFTEGSDAVCRELIDRLLSKDRGARAAQERDALALTLREDEVAARVIGRRVARLRPDLELAALSWALEAITVDCPDEQAARSGLTSEAPQSVASGVVEIGGRAWRAPIAALLDFIRAGFDRGATELERLARDVGATAIELDEYARLVSSRLAPSLPRLRRGHLGAPVESASARPEEVRLAPRNSESGGWQVRATPFAMRRIEEPSGDGTGSTRHFLHLYSYVSARLDGGAAPSEQGSDGEDRATRRQIVLFDAPESSAREQLLLVGTLELASNTYAGEVIARFRTEAAIPEKLDVSSFTWLILE